MKELNLIFLSCIFIASTLYSQNRTATGEGNNPMNAEWGSTGTPTLRIMDASFEDGISEPTGMDRPNPRTISNDIFDQDSDMPNSIGLSDFWWQWGQFIDHDITAIHSDPSEFFPIYVPMGDPQFDPFHTGDVMIPQSRAMEHDGTGTDVANPRAYTNEISTWIDASSIYGSDDYTMNYLRSFVDGKLKMSDGNYLPFNTTTGEFTDPVDPLAPSMANENPFISKLYLSGDERANEQTALLAMHTLFAREHNRLCDELILSHPTWSDEEIFQRARKIVGAYIQRITMEEWLPTAGIDLMPYMGYDLYSDPSLSPIFSGAAFRLGHTMIPSSLKRLDNNGEEISAGDLQLKFAFFNPLVLNNEGGMEPIFKGMALQLQQEVDNKVVGDIRNFLFGPPGSGGLDLAALNINRGRDMGLPDFNTVRTEIGLDAYSSFTEITSDSDLATIMENLYGDINEIDPWVGMLAEDHMSGKAFGETIFVILKEQFERLRDTDWYWFENDPEFSPSEILEIKSTNLADIIRRNTNIENIQNDIFMAQAHQECIVDEYYGCVGCYENGQPEPINLSTQVLANGYFLKWRPVPGSVACQINGGLVGGPQVNINIYGTEPEQKYISASVLQAGQTYQWRVRCGCQLNPTIIAGSWSDYKYFTNTFPAALDINNLEALNEDVLKFGGFDAQNNFAPNPFSNTSIISLNPDLNGQNKVLYMYNTAGNLVDTYSSSDNVIEISKGKKSSGIYFFHIISEESGFIQKGKVIIN